MKTKLLKKIRQNYDYRYISKGWQFWQKGTPNFVSIPGKSLRWQLADVIVHCFGEKKAKKILR